jgi:hypothetical protein
MSEHSINIETTRSNFLARLEKFPLTAQRRLLEIESPDELEKLHEMALAQGKKDLAKTIKNMKKIVEYKLEIDHNTRGHIWRMIDGGVKSITPSLKGGACGLN